MHYKTLHVLHTVKTASPVSNGINKDFNEFAFPACILTGRIKKVKTVEIYMINKNVVMHDTKPVAGVPQLIRRQIIFFLQLELF